jgi:predicted kinase
MKKKIIMTKGLPGSGKSTWAKGLLDLHPTQVKRVNKDDLRAMMDNSKFSKGNEKFVLKVRDFIVTEALAQSKTVIVDDTNLDPRHENDLRKLAITMGAEFEIKDFTHVSAMECIERDALRTGTAHVGKGVIMRMYNQHLKPKPKVVERNPNLPDIVICDLDGTLALIGDRDPYRGDLCGSDVVCSQVAEMLWYHHIHHGRQIFFVTGRPDNFRAQAIAWLDWNGFGSLDYKLFMRAPHDFRPDTIAKQEIYEEHIKGKLNVIVIYEDRSKVVEMWRDLGLKCFQVEPGDF